MGIERLALLAMAVLLARCGVDGRPQSLVLTTTPVTETQEDRQAAPPAQRVFIDKLHVRSDIQFRYSRTQVKSHVKNPGDRAQSVEFEVLLPEKAFISNFTIETGGKVYVSEVKEKQEARETFEAAVTSGQTAGLVDAREGNVFSVQTNVAAEEKLVFTLTYEELLERHLSRYQQSVYVDPKQIVDDLRIDVYINESLPIVDVLVPQIKQQSNEIVELLEPNDVAVTKGANTSQVHVSYHPSPEEQKRINADKGIAGHFIVQYDVDRAEQGSDVQIMDGYFVHFFSPENLPVIPKHVVFVLDVSGSMGGEKIDQLKDSMVTILDDLKDDSFFSILTFNGAVHLWASANEKQTPFYRGTKELRDEAISHVLGLHANGGTNIYDALSEAVEVVKKSVASEELDGVTPVIIFLTDGEPTAGPVTDGVGIKEHLRTINEDVKAPVYGLAFGAYADFNFIKSLSLESQAFARRIYEGSDAAMQLEDFYREISSPLLTNVTFEYIGGSLSEQAANVAPGSTFHKGREYVTVGKVGGDSDTIPEIAVCGSSADGTFRMELLPCPMPTPLVDMEKEGTHGPPNLFGGLGCFPFPPAAPPKPKSKSENFIQRLWAKMTIEQLLDDKTKHLDKTEEEERKTRALNLALEYNFVTDLTSLVVVKPFEKDGAKNESVAELTPVGVFQATNSFNYNNFRVPASGTLSHAMQIPNQVSATGPRAGQHWPTTTTPSPIQAIADYDAIYQHDPNPSNLPTGPTTCPPIDACQLVLHSKTYLRGKTAVVKDSKEKFLDLLGSSATSLEVIGSCSWTLFSETQFGGNSREFHEGKYKSAVSLGSVFRSIKSIKRNHCSD